MTDDRAKRLRALRKRSQRTPDESETASTAEADDSDLKASSTGSVDDSTGSAVDGSGSDGTDSSSSGTALDGESAEPDGTPAAVDGRRVSGRATETTGSEIADTAGGRTRPPDPSRASGDVESVSFDEADVPVEPRAGPDGIETGSAADLELQGAIADTATMVSATGQAGSEPTVDASVLHGDEEYGRAAEERKSDFDGDRSLIHSAHDDEHILQMLEFFLGGSRYAVEIERISAIVEMKDSTRFPRGPDAIDGVTDLRGEITGILDPTTMLDVEQRAPSDDDYIVVLERSDDKQKLGFRVTDVSQAVTYRASQIDETAAVMDDAGEGNHEFVEGIVKTSTDGRTSLVTWLDVDTIIEHTN